MCHDWQINELRIPLAREKRFAFLVLCRCDNQLRQPGVIDDCLCGETSGSHLRYETLHRSVVDVRQRQISDVGVEPVRQAVLPSAERCWLDWLSLAGRLLLNEQLCLLSKCDADRDLRKLLSAVDSARHHD